MKTRKNLLRSAILLSGCLLLASCDDVRVYGSVGYSSWNGYGGGGYGSSIRIGGRLH